jgi:hypothetical protein
MRNRITVKVSIFVLILGVFNFVNSEQSVAAVITATGTNPTACNQTVDVTTGVTAERLANGDCVVKFTAASTTISWTVPTGVTAVNVLVVGGGGAGGTRAGGGGGAGGYLYFPNQTVTENQMISVTVGAGGIGVLANSANNGGDSRFGGLTIAMGGGGGGGAVTGGDTARSGKAGGSGGGAAGNNAGNGSAAIGLGTSGQGFNGGLSSVLVAWPGGGGGGSASVGTAPANNTAPAGKGGGGTLNSISGTSVCYATGGGAGTKVSYTAGAAGDCGGTASPNGGAGTSGSITPATPNANTGAGGGGSGWSDFADLVGGNGASGVVIVQYNPDTTPPTFTSSSSFSAAENIATSVTAATIRVSESATVTISSGVDAARFNISRSDTDTAIIKFNVSPDYEAPTDSGGDNIYNLTLTATDAVANAGTQEITITVTNVVDTSGFSLFQLAGGATVAAYRTAIVLSATVNVASKITFRMNGKVLPGCKNKLATGSGSSFTATCTWKASNRGSVNLTAAATPTDAGISGTTSAPISIRVGNRTVSR